MSPWFQTFSKISAYLLGVLWVLPLLYAFWAAFHPPEYATQFSLTAPLTLENFVSAWDQAPFFRYMLNTVVITSPNSSVPTVSLHSCRLCASTRKVCWKGLCLCSSVDPAYGHARSFNC